VVLRRQCQNPAQAAGKWHQTRGVSAQTTWLPGFKEVLAHLRLAERRLDAALRLGHCSLMRTEST